MVSTMSKVKVDSRWIGSGLARLISLNPDYYSFDNFKDSVVDYRLDRRDSYYLEIVDFQGFE